MGSVGMMLPVVVVPLTQEYVDVIVGIGLTQTSV
jgi:hypothetical protein